MHDATGTTGASGLASWTRGALGEASVLPGVRRVGLALVEGGGRRLQFTADDRGDGGEPAWCHIDAYDDVPLNTAVRTGRPVFGAVEELGERYSDFVERQRGSATVAIAAVPVVAGGRTLGGYVLFYDEQQPFDPAQRRHLEELGARLGHGLSEARPDGQAPAAGLEEETSPGASVAAHEVPADPAGVGPARRFLRDTLAGWGVGEEATYSAELCLSELVTNAVIHTTAGCGVRLLLEDGVLTARVRDLGGHAAVDAEPAEEALRVHGRGLQLVEALSSSWGSASDAAGATVWFTLDLR